MQNVIGSGDHDENLHDSHRHVAQRHAFRHQSVGVQLHVAILGVVVREQFPLVILVGEGLHDSNAAHALLDPRIERPDLSEEPAPRSRHRRSVARRDPSHRRHDQPGDQRQFRIQSKHQYERADECHHRDERILRPVMGHLANLFQILRHAGDEMPRLRIVVESERELLQVIEDLATHLGLDGDSQHMPPVVDNVLKRGIEKVDAQQPRRRAENQPPILARQQPIHERFDR